MNDLMCASILFLVFAAALILYGAVLAKTGKKDLLPYRAQHSIHDGQEVKRVGRIVVVVGLVIGAASLLTICLAHVP